MIADLCSENRSVELKDNTVIVVLGASGDLAKKKTVHDSRNPTINLLGLTSVHSSLLSMVLWVEPA